MDDPSPAQEDSCSTPNVRPQHPTSPGPLPPSPLPISPERPGQRERKSLEKNDHKKCNGYCTNGVLSALFQARTSLQKARATRCCGTFAAPIFNHLLYLPPAYRAGPVAEADAPSRVVRIWHSPPVVALVRTSTSLACPLLNAGKRANDDQLPMVRICGELHKYCSPLATRWAIVFVAGKTRLITGRACPGFGLSSNTKLKTLRGNSCRRCTTTTNQTERNKNNNHR